MLALSPKAVTKRKVAGGPPPLDVGSLDTGAGSSTDVPNKKPRTDVKLECLPHNGLISVDRVNDSQYVITNTLTLEQFKLPPGTWTAEYSEESGFGAAIKDEADPDGTHSIVYFHKVLEKTLLQISSTDEIVCSEVAKNGQERISSFDDLRTQHRLGTAKVFIGGTAASFEWEVAVFVRPRPGCSRLSWNLFQCYRALGLQTYKGQPSRWCDRRGKKMEDLCVTLFGSSHSIKKHTVG